MAKVKIKKVTVQVPTSGSESTLSGWSNFFLVVGIIVPIATLIEIGTNTLGLSLAIYFLTIGLFFKALLSGASDIIRLLKKQCSIPYSGAITGEIRNTHKNEYVCEGCDTTVSYKQEECPNCGEQLNFSISAIPDRRCPNCNEEFHLTVQALVKRDLKCSSCDTEIDAENFVMAEVQVCPYCFAENNISAGERIIRKYKCTSCFQKVEA